MVNWTALLGLSLLVAVVGACSERKTAFDNRGKSSQNAVDSVVQPHTDMRDKTPRSQEPANTVDENESEGRGDISNDNSA